jgi:hypothetical protein
MEVIMWGNSSRPGVGLKPRHESSRPLLPQHARHCPVLEAGSGLGYLVYPPLEPTESFLVEYQGDGRFKFMFFMADAVGKWSTFFQVIISMPIGSVGLVKEETTFMVPNPPIDDEGAKRIMRTFIVPEDIHTPPGAVTIRGAYNFKTPAGWDSVYVPVLNAVDRPVAPMLVVRVETDWYAHESEFRYVLQPGQVIPGAHNMPVGQVFFIPREDAVLRDATEDEVASIKADREEFVKHKSQTKLTTRYGLQYSPQYVRQSRQVKAAAGQQQEREGPVEE